MTINHHIIRYTDFAEEFIMQESASPFFLFYSFQHVHFPQFSIKEGSPKQQPGLIRRACLSHHQIVNVIENPVEYRLVGFTSFSVCLSVCVCVCVSTFVTSFFSFSPPKHFFSFPPYRATFWSATLPWRSKVDEIW